MNIVRININAGGSGSVAAVQTKFDLLYYSIEDTIEDLRSLNRRINNVNGGPHNLNDAVSGVDKRIQTECAKKDNLETTAQQFNTFLNNATAVDTSVAQNVKQNQKTFYKDFPWLRPQDVNAEPSFWEQLANSWNEFWGDVGDWICNLVTNIVEWVKEHAVEIIVGLVCIVVGAVLTYLTGGAFLAALLAGLKAAAISGLIGGAISGVLALFTGGDFWDAFGDGFASGFMWGGIFSAISSAISAIRGFMHGANAVDDVINVADDVVNSTDDVANVADDVINSTDDTLANNRANGKEFANKSFENFNSKYKNAVEEVTVKTPSGVKTRFDAMGLDSKGKVVVNEFKSSATAPLTKNQKLAFPEIYEKGATVVGKGKGIFTGGYQVPPGTKVEIIRPK